MNYKMDSFDVAVVGAGHAGVEAAMADQRFGGAGAGDHHAALELLHISVPPFR